MKDVLVFDMDGVLAEVSGSYLAAIAETVRHFTGKPAPSELIAEYKNAGGWNNDWLLAQKLILETSGREVPYEEVIAVFQKLFLGENGDGLILRETWIPRDGLLEQLSEEYVLAIFSGRPRAEIDLTLRRFVPQISWVSIVGDMDIPNPKPAPDGLRLIAAAHADSKLIYVGDNPDDARSAQAAGVRFIGIAPTPELLLREGAEAVIESVNELEGIL